MTRLSENHRNLRTATADTLAFVNSKVATTIMVFVVTLLVRVGNAEKGYY